MSLLDDARRIAAAEAPLNGDTWCWFCNARLVGYFEFVHAQPHKPECPWLSMPRIVEVLEGIENASGHTTIDNRHSVPLD